MKNSIRKRVGSLLLALALLFVLVPACALPAAADFADVPIDAEYFPDEIFRAYVSNFDDDGDGVLCNEEREFVFELECSNQSISDLTGVAYFPHLEDLDCSYNQLTSLDLSRNTNLVNLDCRNNQLTSLNLSGCRSLGEIFCSYNQLTTLDLSGRPNLGAIYCEYNRLISLDVSGNANLSDLYCNHNQISSLDLSGNSNLWSLYCENNQIETLDLSGNPKLFTLKCDGNGITALNVSQNAALEHLFCHYNLLTTLDVSGNPNLKTLFCACNQLTVLNVNGAAKLDSLSCYINQLTSLDTSGAPELTYLDCAYNQLTALDVSESPKLETLSCDNNQLTALDLSGNALLYSLYSHGNRMKRLNIANNPKLEYVLLNRARDKSVSKYCLYRDYRNNLSFDWFTEIQLSDGSIHQEKLFMDVNTDSYYYVPVFWAVQNGITTGTGDESFSPNQSCTREQVVTFLWKAAGSPEPEATSSPFSDVKPDKYYFKPVLWAVEKGITSGLSDGRFGVGRACTREQVVSFLWKAVGSPEPEGAENPFTDVKPGKYYYKPVLWAVENGVTSGVSATSFGVGKTCTRAQIVTFLYNVYGK